MKKLRATRETCTPVDALPGLPKCGGWPFALAAKANVDVLTTNGTSSQIGFFMFLAFCIAGLVTSTLLGAAIHRETGAAKA